MIAGHCAHTRAHRLDYGPDRPRRHSQWVLPASANPSSSSASTPGASALLHKVWSLTERSAHPRPNRRLPRWSRSDERLPALQRFCTAPASVANHHAYRHGLIEHTVEVAENTLRLCEASTGVNRNLALLAALLHDAGEADEYAARGTHSWSLTDRGRLIGHDTTIVEWVAAASTQARLPNNTYVALLHILTARRGAPDWVGMRQPAMLESDILSQADRLSGQANLHAQMSNPNGGWGTKHRHMRSAPYSVPESAPGTQPHRGRRNTYGSDERL